MNNSSSPRKAANGRSERYSADSMSLLRVTFAKHIAENHFKTPASGTTIIRRALAVYCDHIDALIDLAPTDPRVQREARALAAVNKGAFAPEVPEEQLLAVPVKPLVMIIKEYNAAKPSFFDTMKADLARWKAEDERKEGRSNER